MAPNRNSQNLSSQNILRARATLNIQLALANTARIGLIHSRSEIVEIGHFRLLRASAGRAKT